LGEVAVTLALVTCRRPESLARALAGIAQQRLDEPWELLIVDNDPAASATTVIDAHRGSIEVPIRTFVESQPGAAHARNRAIAEAAGAILVMHDDDVVAPPGWLATLIAPVRDDVADCVGGSVRLDPEVTRPAWFDEPGLGAYLTALDLGPEPRPLVGHEYLVTANLACRTDLLRASGGFDPALGPRPGSHVVCDDVQLVRDVRAAGGRVLYIPNAWVQHELPASRLRPRWLLHRSYWQGRSDYILDREMYGIRAVGGAAVALGWLRAELGTRRREGLLKRRVAFHAVVDVVRTAGSVREAMSLAITHRQQRRAWVRARRARSTGG
jgi:glucosyl-dolichyl phosphate glucuronosyltransferase